MKNLLTALVLYVVSAAAVAEVHVDATYCNGRALLAKATAEARDRKTKLKEWNRNLSLIKTKVSRKKNPLLYTTIPAAIKDASWIYKTHRDPVDVYLTTFNRCMAASRGRYVAVN